MIRKARYTDIARIAEIIIFAKRTAYRPIFQNDQVSFNELTVLNEIEALKKEDALEQIIVYDDTIVKGMMKLGRPSDKDYDNSQQIYELFVDPFFQGAGIGGELMKHCLGEAENQKMTSVILWVLEKNNIARNFYHKYGFSFDGCKKLEEGTEEYILRYEKQL